jgi:hypothetical protein
MEVAAGAEAAAEAGAEAAAGADAGTKVGAATNRGIRKPGQSHPLSHRGRVDPQ